MQALHFISRSLKSLTPYQSLLVLGVPLAIIEPFKLIAVVVAGDGHFIAGVLVMICAYGCSLFVTERLFAIVKPKLLILPWFATIWNWFVTIRGKILRWLRHKWILGAKRYLRRAGRLVGRTFGAIPISICIDVQA